VRVEVRLFANLADYRPEAGRAPVAVELPAGATVDELCRRLGIPEALPRLVLVNGQEAPPAACLGPGDVVSLLPPLAGG
jgi:molybdopterin converting factor small subunit